MLIMIKMIGVHLLGDIISSKINFSCSIALTIISKIIE